jgi:hypothetical protein
MRFSIPARGTPPIDGASWIQVQGVRVADRDLPPFFVRMGLGDDGRLLATGLLIETEEELTTRALRLPLADIVSRFAAAASKPATYKRLHAELFARGDLANDERWSAWEPEGATAADFVAQPRSGPAVKVPRARPGRHGHPPDFYRAFAKDYERAMREHPHRPIRALMEQLGYSEAQVHRFKDKARAQGYLKASKEE